MDNIITAVYEKGVFKPLEDVHIRKHQKVTLIIQPKIDSWESDFRNLLKKVHQRTVKYTPVEIEKDITLVSRQIKKRKYARKSSH